MSEPHHSPTRLIQRMRAGEPQTLVVYGTSLSHGLTPLLRDALVERFGSLSTVINAGLPGRASRTGLLELEARVLVHRPDALLLEFAVNDAHNYWHEPQGVDHGITPEEGRANLERIVDWVTNFLPQCEIILQTMNPAWDPEGGPAGPATCRPELEAHYEGYRQFAATRGLRLLDNHAFWSDILLRTPQWFEELVPDGVHPTPAALREVLIPHLVWQLGN